MAAVPSQLADLKSYLDSLVDRYERPEFIPDDPISVPHAFDDPRDQEVIGLYAALLAWGRRETVLNKMEDLCERMDFRPYAFVRDFDAVRDRAALDGFVHRTFQPIDAFWFTKNLSAALARHETVEGIFADHLAPSADHAGPAIQGFSTTIMSMNDRTPQRLQKHLARPNAGSACKRLNMYLRWMVRPGPVDLGIWSRIQPEQLLLPLDVHAGRQARALGFVERKSNDWKAVRRLTSACRLLTPDDPARYDFAFFGVGAHDDPLADEFTGGNKLDVSSLPTDR
ncbi:TIGR02757 family protein [Longibacter salinarum]|uniref:TIGR02757 family protein n=1 Tax=Longibacter salinarum TaxID=1850348 RepID=A0A2A8D308_9BACT|nr:TIGR02757 family protein [Longibacter salinarum]PEN15325.1 TIGR02757 family protein [Longibacter salinarum]